MEPIVYEKNNCVQCNATKRALKKRGVPFTTVNLDEDAEALATVLALGVKSAPVVMWKGEYYEGYRPDLIMQISKELAETSVTVNV